MSSPKSLYLSFLEITNPVVAANNRSEGSGNLQQLQKVTTPTATYSVLSGYSIKFGSRASMEASGKKVWRKRIEPTPENPTGFLYGDNNSPTMSAATPRTPKDHADAGFGWMQAERGVATEALKKVAPFEVSVGISTTPYNGDTSFSQGRLADSTGINPFSTEDHYTRYMLYVTANLMDPVLRPDDFAGFIDSFRSLCVGGNHTCHANEISPAVLIWRFHAAPGRGGLYQLGVTFPPDETLDLRPLIAAYEDRGVDYQIGGAAAGEYADMSVDDAIKAIQEAGCEHLRNRVL